MQAFVLTLMVLLLTLDASPLGDCTCPNLNPNVRDEVAREFHEAGAVFEGEVKSIETRPAEDSPTVFERRMVTLRVLRVYRGPKEKTLVVGTGLGDSDCGYNFKVGKKYLVYAFANPAGRLTTNICERTRPFWRAAADERYLDEFLQESKVKKKP